MTYHMSPERKRPLLFKTGKATAGIDADAIQCQLYADDTIRCIKEKIATYVFKGAVHPSHIMLWCTSGHIGASKVLGVALRGADGVLYAGPINPFETSSTSNTSSITSLVVDYNSDEFRLLNEYGDLLEMKLHMTTYEDAVSYITKTLGNKSILKYCFPSLSSDNHENARNNKDLGDRVRKNEGLMHLYCKNMSVSSAHKYQIGKAIVSLSFGIIATWTFGFDIPQLFDLLSSDSKWPFVRLVVSHNNKLGVRNMYKLFTPALRYDNRHHVSDVHLKRWTIGNTNTKNSFIEVMVAYRTGVFVIVRIYATHNPKQIVAEARLNAHKNGFLEFSSDIINNQSEFSTYMDAFIDHVSEILGAPEHAKQSRFKITNVRSTLSLHSDSIVPDLGGMTTLASHFKNITAIVPSDLPNTVTFLYKRVPNLMTLTNMAYVLGTHAKYGDERNKAEVLQEAFDVTRGEADQLLADLKRLNYMNRNPRSRNNALPEVRLGKNSSGQIIASINGASDVNTHKAIVTLILFLSYYSDQNHINRILSAANTPSRSPVSPVSPKENVLTDMDRLFGLDTFNADDATPDKQTIPVGLTKKSFQKFALKNLQRADAQVFDASYSRTCQKSANRQPIVVTHAELERINKEYPGSYFDNFISNFGSDDIKSKRNIYICPEIWCPLSRVSMTQRQLEAAGNQCPNPNEPVMRIENQYFEDKTSSDTKTKPRFASFTKKSGKCYPCCFAPSSIETARAKHTKSLKECAVSGTDNNSRSKDQQDQTHVTNDRHEGERYIKGQPSPLETGRYGVLPQSAMGVLPTMNHPQGPGGTGNISRGTDCLVRVGVNDGDLMKSVEWLWTDGKLSSKPRAGILGSLISNLNMEVFMVLNQGRTLRMFIKDGNLTTIARKRFDDWINQTVEGRAFTKSFASSSYETQLTMWSAMENYRRYIADEEIRKTEETVLDACNRHILFPEWVKQQGTLPIVIVCEIDDNGNVNIICDAFGEFQQRELLQRQFGIILKQGPNYEPLCRVRNVAKGSLALTYKFNKGEYPPADVIIDMYARASAIKMDPLCCTKNVLYQVLDYNFRVVGTVNTNKAYREISCCEPLVGKKGRPIFLFVDQVSEHAKTGYTDGFIERSLDERNIFGRVALVDPRMAYHVARQQDDELLARMRDNLMRQFGKKLTMFSKAINGEKKTFFEEKKLLATKLLEFIHQAPSMSNLPRTKMLECVDKLVMEFMLNDRLPQITHNIRKKMLTKTRLKNDSGGDEIVFDQLAVDSGKLWDRFASLANPYVCCPNPTNITATAATRTTVTK